MNRLVTRQIASDKWYSVPLAEVVTEIKYWDTPCCVYIFKRDAHVMYVGSTTHTFAHRTIQHLNNRRSRIGNLLVGDLGIRSDLFTEWREIWKNAVHTNMSHWTVALNFTTDYLTTEAKMIKHYQPILNMRGK